MCRTIQAREASASCDCRLCTHALFGRDDSETADNELMK